MVRKRVIQGAASVLVAALLTAAAVVLFTRDGGILSRLSGSAPGPEIPQRPNIVLILTDDLDVRSAAHMPGLKGLMVEQGVTFANSFVSLSLCCPSRASLLRGQYARNHEVVSNEPPGGGFQKFRALGHENSTVATWLQAAGYRTVLLGKYLNGYPAGEPTYVPPGWDEWYAGDGKAYANYNYQFNENGRVVSYGREPQDYLTDVLSRKATEFIRRTVSDGVPFFIYLAPYVPHTPATPAPRHLQEFVGVTVPRSPSFNEEDLSDKPLPLRRRPLLGPKDMEGMEDLYRKRLQSLLAVDELIGNLVEVLRVTGTLDKTYVFFTSDNGFHMGEHRLPPGKYTAYEEDIRVPLVVRGPGVPAGKVVEHLVVNLDLAPTFAQLAKVPVPEFVDGRSLAPLLQSDLPSEKTWRQAFLVERWQQPRDSPVRPDFDGLRTRDHLYVEWSNGARELYDLRSDPYQLRSLHATADPEFLQQLSSRLKKLRSCAGASCRRHEAEDY